MTEDDQSVRRRGRSRACSLAFDGRHVRDRRHRQPRRPSGRPGGLGTDDGLRSPIAAPTAGTARRRTSRHRQPAPRDHRPVAGRRASRWRTRTKPRHHVQRRDLQLPASCARSSKATDTGSGRAPTPRSSLHAYEEWGERCVERFNGMFAFAVWDRREQRVFLARDRYGIKPLYLRTVGTALLFASEIKSILEHPEFRVERQLRRTCSSTSRSRTSSRTGRCSQDVRTLPGGHTLTVALRTGRQQLRRYWDFHFAEDGEAVRRGVRGRARPAVPSRRSNASSSRRPGRRVSERWAWTRDA